MGKTRNRIYKGHRRRDWERKKEQEEEECKRMGQGAIHLSGSDRSPSGRIGYTQLVCQIASILHCSSCKWDLLPNRGRARDAEVGKRSEEGAWLWDRRRIEQNRVWHAGSKGVCMCVHSLWLKVGGKETWRAAESASDRETRQKEALEVEKKRGEGGGVELWLITLLYSGCLKGRQDREREREGMRHKERKCGNLQSSQRRKGL